MSLFRLALAAGVLGAVCAEEVAPQATSCSRGAVLLQRQQSLAEHDLGQDAGEGLGEPPRARGGEGHSGLASEGQAQVTPAHGGHSGQQGNGHGSKENNSSHRSSNASAGARNVSEGSNGTSRGGSKADRPASNGSMVNSTSSNKSRSTHHEAKGTSSNKSHSTHHGANGTSSNTRHSTHHEANGTSSNKSHSTHHEANGTSSNKSHSNHHEANGTSSNKSQGTPHGSAEHSEPTRVKHTMKRHGAPHQHHHPAASGGGGAGSDPDEDAYEELINELFGGGSGGSGRRGAVKDNPQSHLCDGIGPKNAFARLVYPPDARTQETNPDLLALDLTNAFSISDKADILVSAMTTHGAYLDGVGFQSQLGDNAGTYLQLQLDRERKVVNVYLPQLGLRTSDIQSSRAVELGIGDGWLDTLPLLDCPFQDEKIVVDVGGFLQTAFWTAENAIMTATSYRVLEAKSYPSNVDITAEYLSAVSPITLGFSMMLLSEKSMAPRKSDDRLLYFTQDYTDLGVHHAEKDVLPSKTVDKETSLIWRWDLSKLPNSTIRIYIDPTVPERWRKYFKQGVEAWNDGFNLLSNSGRVQGVLPGDPDWPRDYNMADARFSTISWSISDQVYSQGIAKVDPRSGEIIKADIMMADGWVSVWLRDLDLLIPNVTHSAHQALLQERQRRPQRAEAPTEDPTEIRWADGLSAGLGLLATEAMAQRGASLTSLEIEELMGAGLQSVVMHEVGHILGLRHNFKGSLSATSACLQDKSCTASEGIGSSIMDYLPMNLPSAGKPDVEAFSSVIGAYDKLAIRYGYTEVPGGSPDAVLQEILSAAEAYEVCYDADHNLGEDPYCATEDLGEDPLAYYEEHLARLAHVQKSLLSSMVQPGESWKAYGKAVKSLLSQWMQVGSAALTWVGGIKTAYVHKDKSDTSHGGRRAREPVPVAMQHRAVDLLLRLLRPGREGLLPQTEGLPYLVGGFDDYTYSVDIQGIAENFTASLLEALLSPARLLQVRKQDSLLEDAGAVKSLSVADFLTRLGDGVFVAVDQVRHHKEVMPAAEMNLQLQYVRALKALFFAHPELPADLAAQVLLELRRAQVACEEAVAGLQEQDSSQTLLDAHFALLHRELSTVFCEPGEVCTSPRVPGAERAERGAAGTAGVSVPLLVFAILATFTSFAACGASF